MQKKHPLKLFTALYLGISGKKYGGHIQGQYTQ